MGGGCDRKQGTRVVAYIVIALGMMIVLGIFIFKKSSNRRGCS